MNHDGSTLEIPSLRPTARSALADWTPTILLLLLTSVPMVAGIVRLVCLATGNDGLDDHARFAADPIPAVLHIVGATMFSVGGAFQFVPKLRMRGARFHRWLGWVLVPAGIVGAISGLWMAFVYPASPHDGPLLRVLRVVVATAMVAFLVLAVRAIVRRDFRAHGRWAMRAYALGMGAGTQAFVFLPQALLGVRETPTRYAISMALGWLLNVAFAEWRMAGRTASDLGASSIST